MPALRGPVEPGTLTSLDDADGDEYEYEDGYGYGYGYKGKRPPNSP